jgi:hypothetical protein
MYVVLQKLNVFIRAGDWRQSDKTKRQEKIINKRKKRGLVKDVIVEK